MVNETIFLQTKIDEKILQNLSKYCSSCYKELQLNEIAFLDTQSYTIICYECACCKSQELEEENECDMQKCQEATLF